MLKLDNTLNSQYAYYKYKLDLFLMRHVSKSAKKLKLI